MIDQPTIDRIIGRGEHRGCCLRIRDSSETRNQLCRIMPVSFGQITVFYVSPSKNICKCFACGEGGTAVHFIMKHEQLSYFDAYASGEKIQL